MLSLAFIMSFVISAVALLIGIVIFADIEDSMVGTFGDSDIIIQNATAGGITTNNNSMMVCIASNGSTYLFDKTTGTVVSEMTRNFDFTANACRGLIHDPTRDQWFGMYRNSANSEFVLTEFDPTTGIGTGLLGNGGINLMDLVVDSSGQGFIMHGADGGNPNKFQKIDLDTGILGTSCIIPSAHNHHSIAFNWDNDKMYDVTGNAGGGGVLILQSLDTNTCAVSDTVLIGSLFTGGNQEPHGLTYDTENGVFILFLRNPNSFYEVTLAGVQTLIGVNDVGGFQSVRGLALDTETEVGSPIIYAPDIPESFASASSISLTVLAVIPVALFFTLFTILSPRTDGE